MNAATLAFNLHVRFAAQAARRVREPSSWSPARWRRSGNGVDVAYLLMGKHAPVTGTPVPMAMPDPFKHLYTGTATSHTATEPIPPAWISQMKTQREITQEEAVLLDNYAAADDRGRAAAWTILDALAKRNQTSE